MTGMLSGAGWVVNKIGEHYLGVPKWPDAPEWKNKNSHSNGLQPSSHGCLGVPKWPATEGEEELGINNKFVLELLGQLMFPLKNECYCI